MKKIIATFIAASFLGLGSISFAQDKSAAPNKERPVPGDKTPADANPNVKPPAGAVQDGGDKGKPIVIVDPLPRPKPLPFPKHWGKPPAIQTKDLRPLPGGFGLGSSTLASWIEGNIKTDLQDKEKPGGGKPGDGSAKPGDGSAKPGKPGEKPGGVHPKPPPAPFRPKHPPRPELPEGLQKELAEFKETQDALRDGLKAEIDKLGKGATRDQIKVVAEAFKADNQDAIEAQIAAGKALHDAMKDNRPQRGDFERPKPTPEVKEKADALKAFHQTLGKARNDLHKALKDASDEDRKAMIATFKEEQKDTHQDLKVAKKALREAIRDNAQSGDRRSED